MSDIVERLKRLKDDKLALDAAAEIERLRAALREIRDDPCSDVDITPSGKTHWEIATEALDND